jgi:hypothetical protein
MKPKVCSIENAKKLQELGVKVRGYLSWHEWSKMDGYFVEEYDFIESCDCTNTPLVPCEKVATAYTVGELGELLPAVVDDYTFAADKHASDKWTAGYFESTDSIYHGDLTATASTEADSRAKLLIKLIENGHVKAEEL